MNRFGPAFCLLAILIVAVGCSGGGPQFMPVSGSVKTKAGKPCDNALVVFHPQDKERANDPKPVGTCDENGEFTLTTKLPGDGAMGGKYGVTIVWIGKAKESKMSLSSEAGGGQDQLGGRYGQPQKPKLFAEVKADGENRFEFVVE